MVHLGEGYGRVVLGRELGLRHQAVARNPALAARRGRPEVEHGFEELFELLDPIAQRGLEPGRIGKLALESEELEGRGGGRVEGQQAIAKPIGEAEGELTWQY